MADRTRRGIIKFASNMSIVGMFISPLKAIADESWFDLKSDNGSPVSNSKLPGEITGDLENLPGIIWVGSVSKELTLYEFYDHNCPYCRVAANDISEALKKSPDLRLGLINNAILSPLSVQSAKVELAVLRLKGAATAYNLQHRLLTTKGSANGERALQFAVDLGCDREQLEQKASSPEVKTLLDQQIRTAANLGLSTTPAFVLGNSAVNGYPGPKTLDKIVSSGRICGEISCNG